MEGNAWPPVVAWLERHHGAVNVDLVTAPGAATWFVESGPQAVEAALRMAVAAHGATAVAIAGHAGCQALHGEEAAHKNHVKAAVEHVAGWRLGVPVVGLWLDANGSVRKLAEL